MNALALSRDTGLRLQVFDSVPVGHIVHAVSDASLSPLFRPGEVAVVDPSDCRPIDGGLAMIQFLQPHCFGIPAERWRWDRTIVEVIKRDDQWFTRTYAGTSDGVEWRDGPWCEGDMMDKILGQVVGIFAGSDITGGRSVK